MLTERAVLDWYDQTMDYYNKCVKDTQDIWLEMGRLGAVEKGLATENYHRGLGPKLSTNEKKAQVERELARVTAAKTDAMYTLINIRKVLQRGSLTFNDKGEVTD